MNQDTEKVLDIIYSNDNFFLSVIDVDSPAELKRVTLKFIKTLDERIDVTDIQWKRIYRELKDINDPINVNP